MTDSGIRDVVWRDADADNDLSFPFHFLSHADLLCFPLASGRTPPAILVRQVVDAVIVPTIREADQIVSAAALAAQLGCPLVVIYSGRSADELSSIRREFEQRNIIIIGLPTYLPQYLGELLDFETGSHPEATSRCALDISRKRNLGLLLAQMCGWTKVLFLDDDIRSLSALKVTKATDLLKDYPVVGFQVRDYPDNSVIGHAKRLVGWKQDVFISGGSLLVDPQLLNGFFPPVYHEDWFCSLNHICAGTAAVGGEVEQLAYAPFETPMRAWLEEFADILGEGLLWLIHHKRDLTFPKESFWTEALDHSFWRSALQRRARLLDEIARRLLRLKYPQDGETVTKRPQDEDVLGVLVCVNQAQIRHRELSAEDFVSFIKQWLNDMISWQARLEELPRVNSVTEALAKLDLSYLVFENDTEPQESLTIPSLETRRWPTQIRRMRSIAIRDGLSGMMRYPRDGTPRNTLFNHSMIIRERLDQR